MRCSAGLPLGMLGCSLEARIARRWVQGKEGRLVGAVRDLVRRYVEEELDEEENTEDGEAVEECLEQEPGKEEVRGEDSARP